MSSRCDLACDYCYVYTMADQRWRDRPRLMALPIVDASAARVAGHTRRHGLDTVDVVLHGGEPLLAGADLLGEVVRRFRMAAEPDVTVRFGIQTNGVRLDDALLRLFTRLGVGVSVSVDGDRSAHDRHRRHGDGRGSFAAVADALARLATPPYRAIYHGLLCTVDLRNDPVDTYEHLLGFTPLAIDLLLPHGNWSAPPPGLPPGLPPGGTFDDRPTPYADWLIAVFDRWYSSPDAPTRIRLFDELIQVLLGGVSTVEGIGLGPVAMLVIETDGAIEIGDTLTAAYPGAAATGLHVREHDLDAALALPAVRARRGGVAGLGVRCRACDRHRVCGGGLYAHRYAAGAGFTNPSVYCADLYRLIGHVKTALEHDMRLVRQRRAGRESATRSPE